MPREHEIEVYRGWRRMRTVSGAGRPITVRASENPEKWVDLVLHLLQGRLASAKLVKAGRRGEVYRIRSEDSGIVGKIYFRRPERLDWFKSILRKSRAVRAARGTAVLNANGFLTSPVLAIADEFYGPIVERSLMFSEEIGDATTVFDLLRPGFGLRRDKRRELIVALAREVARLHESRIMHGDMNLHNVLFRQNGGPGEFIWIDTERTKQYLVFSTANIVRGLSQLMSYDRYLTSRDKIQFLNEYCRLTRRSRSARRRLAAATTRRCQRKRVEQGLPCSSEWRTQGSSRLF